MAFNPDQLRVLHFIPFPEWGGVPAASMNLITFQAQRRPTFLLCMNEGFTAERGRAVGAIVEKVHEGTDYPRKNLVRWFKTWKAVVRAVRRHKIDIIHTGSAAGVKYCTLPKRLLGTSIVSHQRDNYQQNRLHLGLTSADHVITVSRWIFQTLPPELQQKATAIWDAVVLPPLLGEPAVQMDRPLRFGLAGRCDKIKGMDLLLEAAVPLVEELNIQVLLRGLDDSLHATQLRQMVAKSSAAVQSRVILEPFSTGMESYYHSIDVAVIPSRFPDPFPLTVMEAMARQKPVIVAGHGGMPEIVTDGAEGFVFKPNDAASLREAIRSAAGDRRRLLRMGMAGRERVERQLDPDQYVRNIDAIYEKVLASR